MVSVSGRKRVRCCSRQGARVLQTVACQAVGARDLAVALSGVNSTESRSRAGLGAATGRTWRGKASANPRLLGDQVEWCARERLRATLGDQRGERHGEAGLAVEED